jgi:hypothetical protein
MHERNADGSLATVLAGCCNKNLLRHVGTPLVGIDVCLHKERGGVK